MGGGCEQNCSHNGFPVCTVEKDPITKEERWLFDGMILRSQLLVILSRRVRCVELFKHSVLPRRIVLHILNSGATGLQVLTDPHGRGTLPEVQGDLTRGRLKSPNALEKMMEIDQAMR